MIYFDFKRIKFSFSFGFFFVVAYVFASGSILSAYSLFFCIVHEFAHLYAMKSFGVGVSEISFYGAGIKISSDSIWTLTLSKQVIVYLAGCLTNILIAFIYLFINANELCIINISLAVLNIMPISYLDGGKILLAIFPQHERILKAVSNITAVLTVMLFVFGALCIGEYSFTSLYITAFVFLMSLILG